MERARFEVWKDIHAMPKWVIKKWQEKKLQKLTAYAYKNISLYHDLWDTNGLKLTDITNSDILKQLPIINKRVFKNKPQEYYINNEVSKTLPWKHTSGSTGNPFKFIPASFSPQTAYADFLSLRFLYWTGIPLTHIIRKTKIINIRMSPASSPQRLFISVADFLKNPGGVITLIRQHDADIIQSYPSILIELSRLITEKGPGSQLKFKYALSYGEMLHSSQRVFIEKTLQCELYNKYGLEELGAVGVECKYHKDFHLNSESFILETVDENGRQVPPEKGGRIILTDLNNYNMPFIRYDTGDYGRILENNCPCGLETERFTIDGRLGLFLNIGPRKIHHFEIAEIFNKFCNKILQYQIVKLSTDFLEIRIIPQPSFDNSAQQQLSNVFRSIIGSEISFQIKTVGHLEHPSNLGKFRPIIDMAVLK